MQYLFGVTLACVTLSASMEILAAQIPPVPDNPVRAHTYLRFNPKKLCPDLQTADAGTRAVVVFWIARSGGLPASISIKSTSGSDALDSAAMDCVAKLRFAPATKLGDGDSIDSWQQIAFAWANPGTADGTRTTTSNSPSSGTSPASETVAGVPALTAAKAGPVGSGGVAESVTVRVCVDEAGRLEQEPTVVHSSGLSSLDQAAVKIAASGSAYYRTDTASLGTPTTGCAQLSIRFDVK